MSTIVWVGEPSLAAVSPTFDYFSNFYFRRYWGGDWFAVEWNWDMEHTVTGFTNAVKAKNYVVLRTNALGDYRYLWHDNEPFMWIRHWTDREYGEAEAIMSLLDEAKNSGGFWEQHV